MSAAREIEDIQRQLVRHQHDHPPVRDLNRESDRRQTSAKRIGEDFARLVGSWTFVVIQVLLTLAWLALNALALVNHWDPYPFQLLNLVMSLEAAVWVSIALMALNRLADRDRLRAQHDYEVDVKAEEEMRTLMTHLEVQDDVLLQVLHRLDRIDREMRRMARRMGIGEDGEGAKSSTA
ncbi:MAG TPA: DUF1003 domain-containing protein [Candidatus Dormibacteraeota bacterium]|jgi:uncharacterized membrane protein